MNGHEFVTLAPDMISAFVSIAMFSAFVVRIKGIKRMVSSGLDLIQSVSIMLLIMPFVRAFMIKDEINKAYLTDETEKWWEESKHDGVMILHVDDGTGALTFSSKNVENGIPDYADNAEKTSKFSSVAIPSEYMPDTNSIDFDVDTYKSQLKSRFTKSIKKALDDHKLIASDDFYKNWRSLSKRFKSMKLDVYSNDAINSLINQLAIRAMTSHHTWVSEVMSTYEQFCNELVAEGLGDRGINGLINSQKLTHGFEGEIKDIVPKICDQATVLLGDYYLLASSCVSQDKKMSKSIGGDCDEVQNYWNDTSDYIDGLSKIDGGVLTGNDNFCYLKNGVLAVERPEYRSDITVHTSYYITTLGETYTYDGLDKSDWRLVYPGEKQFTGTDKMVDNVCSQILYHYYLAQRDSKDGAKDFWSYLKKNGVDTHGQTKGNITTNLLGADDFSLADAPSMTANYVMGNLNLFTHGESYNVNKGNSSKIENDCFVVHDNVLHDYLDTSTGEAKLNQALCRRALYAERKWCWNVDEVYAFFSGCNYGNYKETTKKSIYTYNDYQLSFSTPITVLTATSTDSTGEEYNIGGYSTTFVEK